MNHSAYRHLPREILGTFALVAKLSSVMYSHMKNVLPSIVSEINHKIKNCESNLLKLGTPVPIDTKEKLDKIWREIIFFYQRFKADVKGDFIDDSKVTEREGMRVLAAS